MRTCCYVLSGAKNGIPATYCGRPTKYKMVRDDDGNSYRKYEAFCEEHSQKPSKWYELVLTSADRQAIDWIGDRYSHGYDLFKLLWNVDTISTPDDVDWESNETIIFSLPKHIVQKILRNAEEEDVPWSCFSDELANKLNDLIERI